MNTWQVCGSALEHLAHLILYHNIAMTSCALQALMSFKAGSTEEYLADKTVRGSGIVLITTATFLDPCAAIF